MTDQQELSPDFNYSLDDVEQHLTAEPYLEPVSNEKSPQAQWVFVVGKHLEMLRNEVITKRNE